MPEKNEKLLIKQPEKPPIRDTISKADMLAIKNEGVLKAVCFSSGPGGQNVNKNATAAEFRWRPRDTQVFNSAEIEMIINWMRDNKPKQLTKDGEILIVAHSNKSLSANQKQIFKILHQYFKQALTLPKTRIPTKPSQSANEQRIAKKKKRSAIKAMRNKVFY
ncbi:hypothetical protein D6827_00685, partial [Candidatus Parcubacteria bacterium]